MDYYELMHRFNRFPLLILFAFALSANAKTPDSKLTASISSALDSQLFYQLLLGELNARGGEPGAGYSLMLDAARKSNDTRLFQRAVGRLLPGPTGHQRLVAATAPGRARTRWSARLKSRGPRASRRSSWSRAPAWSISLASSSVAASARPA